MIKSEIHIINNERPIYYKALFGLCQLSLSINCTRFLALPSDSLALVRNDQGEISFEKNILF